MKKSQKTHQQLLREIIGKTSSSGKLVDYSLFLENVPPKLAEKFLVAMAKNPKKMKAMLAGKKAKDPFAKVLGGTVTGTMFSHRGSYEAPSSAYAHLVPNVVVTTNKGPGSTGSPIKTVVSEQSVYERSMADFNYAQKVREDAEKQDLVNYEKQRWLEDLEQSGAHEEATLNLARNRVRFWSKVNAMNVRKEFLIDVLGFDEARADMLKSGKYDTAMLGKEFSNKMAEYELAGSLPKSMSQMPTGRIASFGMYSRERGAQFLGMFDSGKSAFITEEQQPGFLRNVFGRTAGSDILSPMQYRIADTGEIATPRQLSRMKIIQSLDPEAAGIRASMESQMEEFKKKAKQEKLGQISPYAEPVDLYKYNAMASRQTEAPPEETAQGLAEEMQERQESLYEQGIAEAEAEVEKQALEDLGEESSIPREELDIRGNKIDEVTDQLLRGEITSDEAQEILGAQDTSAAMAKTGTQANAYREAVPESVGTIPKPGYYQRRYEEVRKKYNKIFPLGPKVAGKKRERRFIGYSADVKEKYKEIGLGGLSREEMEDVLGRHEVAGQIPVKIGKKQGHLIPEEVTRFSDLYLRSPGRTAATKYSSIRQHIPDRALSEQVFEVYFKQSKDRHTFGAYTAAGTYLGETAEGVRPPEYGWGKIFKDKAYFDVAWSSSEGDFYTNKFLSVGRGPGAKPELRSIYDVTDARRLRYSRKIQETLSNIYSQPKGQYGLIDKYRWSPEAGAYVDVATGAQVGEEVVTARRAGIRAEYMKHHRDLLRQKLSNAARPAPGEGVLGGLAKSGKRGMILGAIGLSAALLTIKAASAKKYLLAPEEVPSSGDEPTQERFTSFSGRQMQQPSARVMQTNTGTSGYTTNIDISATNTSRINPNDLAAIMDRHARHVLGSNNGKVTVEISDNSDRSTDHDLQRKYHNMMRD